MLPRTLHEHKLTPLNEALEVTAHDLGPGGAPTRYDIAFKTDHLVSLQNDVRNLVSLRFQNGPIQSPDDINGLTNEALLAIVIDRLRCFQHPTKPDGSLDLITPGPFACHENATALYHLESALQYLHDRSRARLLRGVEGTLTP
jgi:hypothetical protein